MTDEQEETLRQALSYCIDVYDNEEATNRIIEFIKATPLQLLQTDVISNEMEVCDCEIPKPIDPFHDIDKQVCKDCSGFIEQTYL